MIRIGLLVVAWLHLPLVVLHLAFPRLFDWGGDIPKLSLDNQAIFWCFHVILVYVISLMGGATFILARRGRPPAGLDRLLLLAMGGFYLLRAGLELPLFGVTLEGFLLMALVGAMGAVYLGAAWGLLQTNHHSHAALIPG